MPFVNSLGIANPQISHILKEMWFFFKSVLGNGTVTACSNGSCLQVRTKWLRSIFKAIILSVNHMIIPVRRDFIKITILPYKHLRFLYLNSEMRLEFFILIWICHIHFCMPKLCIVHNVLNWSSWTNSWYLPFSSLPNSLYVMCIVCI